MRKLIGLFLFFVVGCVNYEFDKPKSYRDNGLIAGLISGLIAGYKD